MLVYANMAIDAIQNIKTQSISTLVKDKEFAEPLQSFVNAQTSFAKTVAKSTNDFIEALVKFDYTSLAKAAK